MKKRVLTVFLALVLCIGLAVPAFASQPLSTGEETMRNITVSFEAGGKTFYPIKAGDFEIDRDNPYHVEKEMKFVLDNGSTTSATKYVAIPSNALFTVRHTGLADKNSYIQVYARIYVNDGSGRYEPEWNADMVLAQDGFFHDSNLPLFFPPVSLEANQSTQFQLPVTIHSDDYICTLEVRVFYPETKRFSTTSQYIYKVDDDAVKAYLAAENDVPSFTDVPSWCSEAVDWAVAEKVTNGTSETKFSPDENCTQAQILTMLWRALGEPAASVKIPVEVPSYYAGALSWAYENELVDHRFMDTPCTRSTAMWYIWQVQGCPDAKTSGFTDVDYNAEAINWAVENGITNGTSPTTFSPDQVCTRGQIVTFLHRTYVEEARLTGK